MSINYTMYIIEHRRNVRKAYRWLVEKGIVEDKCKWLGKIETHDVSKYLDEEYKPYDDYFYGEKTKAVKEAFDYAWLHHIHHNQHHWQYWVLINDDDGTVGLEMPKEYVYEMICDWWAFSHKSGNLYEVFGWYESHKDKMILHENTRKLVEEILDRIKQILDEEKE